jgi:hypothetical protein
MSFNDTFWLTAVLFLMALPLVFLLGKKAAAAVPAAH